MDEFIPEEGKYYKCKVGGDVIHILKVIGDDVTLEVIDHGPENYWNKGISECVMYETELQDSEYIEVKYYQTPLYKALNGGS